MKKIKILAIICVLAMATNVHAALQTRPGVEAKYRRKGYQTLAKNSDFFKLIREMEAENGALGLHATFAEDSTTGAYEETSVSNNIDTHMVKNKEWGAAAMLSASDYGIGNGNLKYDYNRETSEYGLASSTTGNLTGVFGMNGGAGYEITAAGITTKMSKSENKYIISATDKYVDRYPENEDQYNYSGYIIGDATYETMNLWRGSSPRFIINSFPLVIRNHVLG